MNGEDLTRLELKVDALSTRVDLVVSILANVVKWETLALIGLAGGTVLLRVLGVS